VPKSIFKSLYGLPIALAFLAARSATEQTVSSGVLGCRQISAARLTGNRTTKLTAGLLSRAGIVYMKRHDGFLRGGWQSFLRKRREALCGPRRFL
jgi:hypothetical protein